MNHNFTAGRLREYVQFYTPSKTADDYGIQIDEDVYNFDARANVDVKSGMQKNSMGHEVSEMVITVLSWFNDAVNTDQVLKWKGMRFRVIGIQPDFDFKSMVVTATFDGDVSFGDEVIGNEPTPHTADDIRVGIPLAGVTTYTYNHIGRVNPRVWFIDVNGDEVEIDVNIDQITNVVSIESGIALHGTLYIQ